MFPKQFIFLSLTIFSFSIAQNVYGPKSFVEILDSDFPSKAKPNPISSIQNLEHVIFFDQSMSNYLSVSDNNYQALETAQATLSSESIKMGGGKYSDVMRGIFQILDRNTSILSAESLTGEYVIHPELMSYYAIDADIASGAATASSVKVRDKSSYYLNTNSIKSHLVFKFTGTPSSAKIQAISRYDYNSAVSDYPYEKNSYWSSSQYLKMDANGVSLVSNSSDATNFVIANANDLIQISFTENSDFNPHNTPWQTNSFADWPVNPKTNEPSPWAYAESQLKTNSFYDELDDFYTPQLGDSESSNIAADSALQNIITLLSNRNESLRYSKETYLTFRKSLLKNRFAAVDMYNAVLGEKTVENVYFTNAADDSGNFHPFMIIATHNAHSGPQHLIDVPRPPGDGSSAGGYENQKITRNAVIEAKIVKIPLKDYGLASKVADNDLTPYGSLAIDANVPSSDWNVDNHTSLASLGIAADGVVIYPITNNTLVYSITAGEVTTTGSHVGRGMGFHYHADGHSLTGNGINLYNLDDYTGSSHPPLVGFIFDGVALFGKYETSYNNHDGYSNSLDEYGGHSHDKYSYHYHAFQKDTTSNSKGSIVNYTAHILFRAAFKGLINEVPGLFNLNSSQYKDDLLKRYVGATGTVVELSVEENNNVLIPTMHTLLDNYPNPFNPSTSITFGLSNSAPAKIIIFNLVGQKIKTFDLKNLTAGFHTIKWDGTDFEGQAVSAGMYFFQLQTPEMIKTKRMVLLK